VAAPIESATAMKFHRPADGAELYRPVVGGYGAGIQRDAGGGIRGHGKRRIKLGTGVGLRGCLRGVLGKVAQVYPVRIRKTFSRRTSSMLPLNQLLDWSSPTLNTFVLKPDAGRGRNGIASLTPFYKTQSVMRRVKGSRGMIPC